VGGQSRKMAKPIFGRGLAMRCERSEHGKSQLSLKYSCSILAIFFIIYSYKLQLFVFISLSFFASKWHCASRIASNEQGLGAGGASTAARTGAKLANSHKLSGEPLPRLRQVQVMCRIYH